VRYEVVINRTEYTSATVWVEATDRDDAIEKAHMQDGEYEMMDAEEDYIVTELAADHYVSPVSYGKGVTRCKSCDKPVRWTGTHVPGQPTIPGPWVHMEEK